jgi:GWxTD domain-containing protein
MNKSGFPGRFLVWPGLVLLALAFTACSGSKIELDPVSKEFYEYAGLIMTGEEREIFKSLPDKLSREEFIQEFWDKRDPDPDTPENEFREEFFRRIEYANDRFIEGGPGWKTDRGRIYIYLGPPDKTDEIRTHMNPNFRGPILYWMYYRYGFAVRFIDENETGRYIIDYKYDSQGGLYGSLFDAIESAKFGLIYGEDDNQFAFLEFTLEYNEDTGEFELVIPLKGLEFAAEGDKLTAEFDFSFNIVQKGGEKLPDLEDSRSVSITEDELLEMKRLELSFPYDLPPGKYSVDVVIVGRPGLGKARRIFEIKR